ncbi:hypothetical protein TVAG_374190 [Trichomonas vaginalis G3]|uniref:Right handed beta helix domain-containing protein n=1 Tax=Trichomonas vaginalis (strain ATCC PRA-98 / G3) TaxID=412133 RepID=A2EBV0_TRIV3|nr:hypothetical protein TVAGG3_0463950 [Trichomonas vaginalis G3]EAY09912.1 hypothetical protein TVAG_374190 [Trichomonas vaginalis G3]KAI5514631.1 hypothetical protein TVAGG3_0463950 [Trichomonas vaginalis G3]|eukprot:XP_001322135.1 hypothetical protein [Trichomonas vaginalis G3]
MPPIMLEPRYNKHEFKLSHSVFSRSSQSFIFAATQNTLIDIQNSEFRNSLDSAVTISASRGLNKYISKQIHINSEPNHTFVNCYFVNCHTNSKYGGGAIFFDEINGNLKIKKSTFYKCSTSNKYSNGGAILVKGCSGTSKFIENCFTKCTTIQSGQGFFLHSSNMFTIMNRTSFHFCPDSYSDSQSNSFAISSDIMVETTNQSCSTCYKTPIFSIRGETICTVYFFQANNNTCVDGSSLYQIVINKQSNVANAGNWSIVNGINQQNIGYYYVDEFIHSFLIVSKCGSKTRIQCGNGKLTLRYCTFESPLEAVNKTGVILSENSIIGTGIFQMKYVFTMNCGSNIEQSLVDKASFASIFVLSVLCLVLAILFSLAAKASKMRNEKIYELLSIPETEN